MKKKLTQILVLAIALTIGAAAFAQTPTTATRQRKATPDGPQPAVTADQTTTDSTATMLMRGMIERDPSVRNYIGE